MTELNSTLLSVILILGTLLIVVVIFVIVRVSKTIGTMQEEITQLTDTVIPLVERMSDLTQLGFTSVLFPELDPAQDD